MTVGEMRLKYPGLFCERLPSGNERWRVRPKENPRRPVTIKVTPDHPDFHAAYIEARNRSGPKVGPMTKLAHAYLTHLAARVQAGEMSPLTLKERKSLIGFILAQESQQERSKGRAYATLPLNIPETELLSLRDRLSGLPGKRWNVFKAMRAMFAYGVEYGHCATNPVASIKVPRSTGGGAVPWSVDDLEAFRKAHPAGTMAHLSLTLFMFTGCRISDAVQLGRKHEVSHGGTVWLKWEPRKAGGGAIEIPMMPPLRAALSAQKVVGPAYLLNEKGQPFASPEVLRNAMKRWCKAAGLDGRTSHGIRKAAGNLLALHGATQHEIMAVLGHARASTSEIYTRDVDRRRLGEKAAERLAGLEW